MVFKFWRKRKERIHESEAAIEHQERLGEVIDWQREEAAEVSKWAQEKLRMNHLTELFLTTRKGHHQ